MSRHVVKRYGRNTRIVVGSMANAANVSGGTSSGPLSYVTVVLSLAAELNTYHHAMGVPVKMMLIEIGDWYQPLQFSNKTPDPNNDVYIYSGKARTNVNVIIMG